MLVIINIQKECADNAEAKEFKNRLRTLLQDEENIKVTGQISSAVDMKSSD